MGDKAYHEKQIRHEERKLHRGNNDGYVPKLEKGDGGGHAKQSVKLWQHAQGEGCYDTSAHPDQDCFGEVDKFHRIPTTGHVSGGPPHGYGYGAHQRRGHLRDSGHSGAHKVGHRGKR